MQVKACPFASFLDDREIHPDITLGKRDGEFPLGNSQSISQSSGNEAKGRAVTFPITVGHFLA